MLKDNQQMDKIIYIPLEVKFTCKNKPRISMLEEIAKNIRTDWINCELRFDKMNEGYSNHLYIAYPEKNLNDKIIIRINGIGTEVFTDRNKEHNFASKMAENNLGPKIYGKFINGLCIQYIYGTHLTFDETIKLSELIAIKMAKMHAVDYSSANNHNNHKRKQFLFTALENFSNNLPNFYFSGDKKFLRIKKFFPSKEYIANEILLIHEAFTNINNPIVLCHNDVHSNNLLKTRDNDLLLIDYEFMDYNYAAFDIGNHLMKYCGVKDFDITRFPCSKSIMKWIEVYLEHWKLLTGDEQDIKSFYSLVKKCAIISNLIWCLWALNQYMNSDALDYFSYACKRAEFYMSKRSEIFE